MLSVPPPTRVALGTLQVAGQKVELFVSTEWARYFQSLTSVVLANSGALAESSQHTALLSDAAEAPDFFPSPPGTAGAKGEMGFALFMLQDDMSEQTMLMPPSVDGAYVPLNSKDASGGVPALTLFKLNLKNVAGAITSWFTTAATAARTWTMPDKDGTVAVLSDFASPPAIGATAPAAGSFTTVSASAQSLGTSPYSVAPAIMATTTAVTQASTFASSNSDASQFLCGYSGSSADPTPAFYWKSGGALRFAVATNAQAGGFAQLAQLDTVGWKVTNGFGCNGKNAQPAVASGGTLAGVIAALVANGILSS